MDNKITFEAWKKFLWSYGLTETFDPFDYFVNHFGVEDERLRKLKGNTLLEYIADKYVEFPNTMYGG